MVSDGILMSWRHWWWWSHQITTSRGIPRLSTSGEQEWKISSFFYYFLPCFLNFCSFSSSICKLVLWLGSSPIRKAGRQLGGGTRNFFCGGIEGEKCGCEGAKIQKFARNGWFWPFFFWRRGSRWQSFRLGGMPPMPPWCHHWGSSPTWEGPGYATDYK